RCPAMRFLPKPLFAIFAAFLFLSSSSCAFESHLSEQSARSAYFLGQRKDTSMSEFLARYAKHLPPPKIGPYVSAVTFSTPFAQLVEYSSRQGQYNAQQAELDAKTKFSTVDITVYISLTETYTAYTSEPSHSRYSTPTISLRRTDFWREFKFRVFDGDELVESDSIYGDPQYLCSETGCFLTGSLVHLPFSAEAFTSSSATIEIETPDDQFISVNFDLAAL